MSKIIDTVKKNSVAIGGALAIGGAIGATVALNAQPTGAACLLSGSSNIRFCMRPPVPGEAGDQGCPPPKTVWKYDGTC